MAASTLQRIPPNFVCPVDIVVCICKRRRLGCLPYPGPLSPVHIRLNWMTNNQLFTFQYTQFCWYTSPKQVMAQVPCLILNLSIIFLLFYFINRTLGLIFETIKHVVLVEAGWHHTKLLVVVRLYDKKQESFHSGAWFVCVCVLLIMRWQTPYFVCYSVSSYFNRSTK